MKVIQRICKWNQLRYVIPYHSKKLTLNLLEEELEEFKKAETIEEELDALGDIVFIAIGAMWKYGLKAKDIEAILLLICDNNDLKPSDIIPPDKKYSIKGKGSVNDFKLLEKIKEVYNNAK